MKMVGGAYTMISSECCMCGDYGLSQELFRCKICRFRYQHKYCSNQYPKADSYKACNWCLPQKHESGNSSNSSSSCRNNSGDDRKRNPNGHGGLRERRRSSELQTAPIKKLHGSSAEEKNQISGGGGLRKSKSANQISSGGGRGGGVKMKQVFRNKVRRYKLLDEVSIQ